MKTLLARVFGRRDKNQEASGAELAQPVEKGHFAPNAEAYLAQITESIIQGDARLAEGLRRINASLAAIADQAERAHLSTHVVRWLKTIAMVPDGSGRLLDIGSLPYYSDALSAVKGWNIETIEILSIDYEVDRLPYPDASFGAVLLCEVIEHFVIDPLFCLIEINRILAPGGTLVVTTPNTASWFAVYQVLAHKHPYRWPVYSGNPAKSRHHAHAREYTYEELRLLLEAAGFEIVEQVTLDYGIAPPLPPLKGFETANRGETIFASCRKVGPPRYRYVAPIYLETEPMPGNTE